MKFKPLSLPQVCAAIAAHYTPREVESMAKRGKVREGSIVHRLAYRWGIRCSAVSLTQS